MISQEIPVSIGLPAGAPRSIGVHVSAIIRCIATEAGILKAEWAEELSLVDVREITDPVALLRINIGLAWESHYIPMLEGVLDHPGEMQVDGIYMTHDGESVDLLLTEKAFDYKKLEVRRVVHEVKATYKSTKTVGDLSSQFMWLAQMKGYCKGLNTRFARMHVLFLCGNYKFPISPQLKVWDVEFTQEEIESNWELLRDYRDHRLLIEAEQEEGITY